MTDLSFTLSSGRAMGVTTLGEPFTTRIVVFCHPMPGASDFDPNPEVTRDAQVRMLAFDRPGYGGSEPLGDDESRSVQARADDIAEFLTSKRMEPELVGGADFGVVGWGFGGAVALSLAARHPHLISRAAIVGLSRKTLLSLQKKEVPALEGIPPAPGPRRFGWDALGISSDDPGVKFAGAQERLDAMLAHAAAQGTAGMDTDKEAIKDLSWIEELGSIRAATTLVYGLEDPATEAESGDWFRHRIPNARVARVRGGAGLVIVSAWRRILDRVTGA